MPWISRHSNGGSKRSVRTRGKILFRNCQVECISQILDRNVEIICINNMSESFNGWLLPVVWNLIFFRVEFKTLHNLALAFLSGSDFHSLVTDCVINFYYSFIYKYSTLECSSFSFQSSQVLLRLQDLNLMSFLSVRPGLSIVIFFPFKFLSLYCLSLFW